MQDQREAYLSRGVAEFEFEHSSVCGLGFACPTQLLKQHAGVKQRVYALLAQRERLLITANSSHQLASSSLSIPAVHQLLRLLLVLRRRGFARIRVAQPAP